MPEQTEDEIKEDIRKFYGLSEIVVLFTNPVGNGFFGQEAGRQGNLILLKNWRRQMFGLFKGSSDLVGWLKVKGLAIFLCFEVKTRTGKATAEQLHFIEMVRAAGGCAGVVRSVEDCEKQIAAFLVEKGLAA